MSLVEQAQQAAAEYLRAGGLALDATVGNGRDTLFLAGLADRVYGFDIQDRALAQAGALLARHGLETRAELFLASHADMAAYLPAAVKGRVKAAMFNLGYLPGGDKRIITRTEATLAALRQALDYLEAPGIVTVLAYPGHAGGDAESEAVAAFCAALPPGLTCRVAEGVKPGPAAKPLKSPRLYMIRKSLDLI